MKSATIQHNPTSHFKRAYRACTNCRQRKVKCDLGDIDNPQDPPCARCRRQNKECILATSRRGGDANVRYGRERKLKRAISALAQNDLNAGSAVNLSFPGQISISELHNTSDALDILAHAARNFPRLAKSNGSFTDSKSESQPASYSSSPAPESTTVHTKLKDVDLLQVLRLSAEDVHNLVNFFFTTLHPFYPYIPEELHNAEVLADMPFLLTAILTLASRYIDSDNQTSEKATYYNDLHFRLWDYCQMLFSKTVWAEASSRSIGSVFAFLLFSEWNPRAIHLRGTDYANSPETSNPQDVNMEGSAFSAFRRSDRMAWMLIGNAIRLAQDMDLFYTSPMVYMATNLSETVLALRLGRRSMLGDSLKDADSRFVSLSVYEQARLEMLRIMSLAHETLYSSRKATRKLVEDGNYIGFLGLFTPHLNDWQRKYNHLLKPSNFEREALLMDYHYACLYIYSIALSVNHNSMNGLAASRYVSAATYSAKELILSTLRVHSDHSHLRRAPIRWIVRIVHAAVFLLKSVLLMPASTLTGAYQKQTVDLIRAASFALVDAAPDNVHLSSKYGKILLALCDQVNSSEDDGVPKDGESTPAQKDATSSMSIEELSNNTASPKIPPIISGPTGYDEANILNHMNMDFDFFTEGTEGLGFVEPFMKDLEQQEWLQKTADQPI